LPNRFRPSKKELNLNPRGQTRVPGEAWAKVEKKREVQARAEEEVKVWAEGVAKEEEVGEAVVAGANLGKKVKLSSSFFSFP